MANPSEFTPPAKAGVSRFARERPLTTFFVLTYLWSWSWWLVIPRFVDEKSLGSIADLVQTTLFLAGAFGPMVGALITRWLGRRNLRICRVWTGWGELVRGLGVGLLSFIVATLVVPAIAFVKAPPSALHWAALLHWSTYGFDYSTLLGGPLSEEPGWRGFALPRLQARYGPILATLILAPLWAGWHLPLFQIEGWSTAKPWQFLLILMGISFLLTAAANLAKFGVIVPIALHAFFNTSSRLGNVLGENLPRRNDDMMIYTFVVFLSGTVLGIALLWLQRKWPRTNGSRATWLSLREAAAAGLGDENY